MQINASIPSYIANRSQLTKKIINFIILGFRIWIYGVRKRQPSIVACILCKELPKKDLLDF